MTYEQNTDIQVVFGLCWASLPTRVREEKSAVKTALGHVAAELKPGIFRASIPISYDPAKDDFGEMAAPKVTQVLRGFSHDLSVNFRKSGGTRNPAIREIEDDPIFVKDAQGNCWACHNHALMLGVNQVSVTVDGDILKLWVQMCALAEAGKCGSEPLAQGPIYHLG